MKNNDFKQYGVIMNFLHTMIRVGDLDKSIEFYTDRLGMELLGRDDYEHGRFTLAFLGFEGQSGVKLELTHNWDTQEYDLGNGYGHIAFGDKDIYSLCKKLKENGVEITREPGPMKGSSTHLAFIKDPDGYLIEFIQN